MLQFCEFLSYVASKINQFGGESSNYGSLVAALMAALIIFAIREVLIRSKNYSGVFFTKSTVEMSSYNPYMGMQVFHTLVLYSDGYVVSGTSEKTGDIDKKRSYEFQGAGKIRGVVTGRIERNYFFSSVMNLHIVEQGVRESTSFMTITMLRYRRKGVVNVGAFYSTAANAKGSVLCGRDSFKDHPIGYVPCQSTAQ